MQVFLEISLARRPQVNRLTSSEKAVQSHGQTVPHLSNAAIIPVMLCLMFMSSCEAAPFASIANQIDTPFIENARYNPTIPTPESILGHGVGEHAVRYQSLVRYLQVLSEASDRVTLTEYGRSHEGRTSYYLTITSPANHRRISAIKAQNAELADPRKMSDPQRPDRLIAENPAVAWLNYSIHGDELSSTDAAVYVAYHLVAAMDDATNTLLDHVVVNINPLTNPDGRERYLSHLQQLTGIVSSPDTQSMQHQALWSRGRGNHYLFDLNRDWLIHRQPEVRDLAEVILSWNPQLLIDSHEQGAHDTYLFDPPREPLNVQLSPKILEWRRRFSADQAAAFNRHGWSYYTEDWYSEWSPIYTNAWASLQGSIGLLYEQARANSASVKQATGRETSYRQTVHHHIVSSLANLDTLHKNRAEIMKDFYQDRKWAVSEQAGQKSIFLMPPCDDTARWSLFTELIQRQGIEAGFAAEPVVAAGAVDIWGIKHKTREFPKGTLVVRVEQPRRRMLRALCDFDPRMQESFLLEERKELENRRDSLIYDVTSWNLPMIFGLDSYWADSFSDAELSARPVGSVGQPLAAGNQGTYGYLVDFGTSSVYPALVRLLASECHPRIAIKPFTFDGRQYKAGAVLLRSHENPENLPGVLAAAVSEFDLDVRAVDTALTEDGPDLGSRKFRLLAQPRVAIASQWPVRSTSFGSAWYLLDHRLRLRCSPVNVQNLGAIDLRKYNVLVLPDGRDLGRVLSDGAVKKVKTWVEAGGTLIAMGGSAVFAADEDRGLSSVRLRRNVLDKLPEYAETVEREKNARDVEITPDDIWSAPAAEEQQTQTGAEQEADAEPAKSEEKPDTDTLKRTDQWRRIFSPEGTFLAGMVNTEHWLGFGLQERLPIMIMGGYAFMSKHPARTVVRLADENELRVSGLLWPEARQRLANTAYTTVESMGNGQVILFANDPTFRMWLAAEQRLFLNAIVLGPGMGASQPLPW